MSSSTSFPQPTVPAPALVWEPPSDEPVAFSGWGGSAAAFAQRLNYGGEDARDRDRRRGHGDLAFLGRVQDAIGPNRAVNSISESELEDVVDETERDLWSDRWRLSGDEGTPTMERVDKHFSKPQQQWAAEVECRARARELQERQAKERQLVELRGHIGLGRERVEEGKALLEAMEADLAAAAADLGVPAWP